MTMYRSSYWTSEMQLKKFFSQANSMQEHLRQFKEAIAKGEIKDFRSLSWTHQIHDLKNFTTHETKK